MYCICNVNFIGKFKNGNSQFTIEKGQPIGILYPIIPSRKIEILPFCDTDIEQKNGDDDL